MNAQRYPEEFRIEAVKQILEHGHSVADVSRRLGVSTHSLYKWIKLQQIPAAQRLEQVSQSEELRRIKAELSACQLHHLGAGAQEFETSAVQVFRLLMLS